MIVVKLQGGLGNQLFQWAFAKNLSNLLNVPFFLDLTFLNQTWANTTKREFSLNKFPNLNFQIIDFEHIKNNSFNFINEYNCYENINYISIENYYLDGYFQNEKFFIKSKNLIKKELQFENYFLQNIILKYPVDKNTVSLHIRRTDYLNSNGIHPVQPISYYQNALDIIGKYDNVFIFSDDIEWCKNNLNFSNMIFIENLNDVETIWLMSLCKHNIIANSTFSWWGAWLNQYENKKIIAPKNWFGQQPPNLLDNLIPSNWIKI